MEIGNVVVEKLKHLDKPNEQKYSDGPVEDELLKLVKSPDFKSKRWEIIKNNPTWAHIYHFSPLRANIINWYSFKKNIRILEIGAGCGAITEALLDNTDESIQIDALELSEKRATINAYRNRKIKKNRLRVLIGNLEDLDVKQPYDIIVCIGVLEYAGRFMSDQEPYLSFLQKIRSLLSNNGELFLAIENKLGIKYINGAREDHLGRFYESIMSYPQYDGIRTFSRKELLHLLTEAGLPNQEVMLPVPDYKLPRVIINEKLLTNVNNVSYLTKFAPAPNPDQSRIHSASEQLFTQSAVDAGIYLDLANSFLVRAS